MLRPLVEPLPVTGLVVQVTSGDVTAPLIRSVKITALVVLI
jgi:hypothetical protein